MQRRLLTTSNESESEIEEKPSLTYEEAANSFERKDTRNQKEQSQATAKQKEEQKKEASKRPLSDSSNTPPLTRKKQSL